MSGYGEILISDNFLTKEECNLFCKKIDELIEYGYTHEFNNEGGRRDECIFLNLVPLEGQEISSIFFERFNTVLKQYVDLFPILKSTHLGSLQIKAQRTPPGGGFHNWHFENVGNGYKERMLAWTVYLNDDFGGGETEFIYQNTRVEAVPGRFCMFPAGFLHTHRGNPPIEGTKYILTGWVCDLDPYSTTFNQVGYER